LIVYNNDDNIIVCTSTFNSHPLEKRGDKVQTLFLAHLTLFAQCTGHTTLNQLKASNIQKDVLNPIHDDQGTELIPLILWSDF